MRKNNYNRTMCAVCHWELKEPYSSYCESCNRVLANVKFKKKWDKEKLKERIRFHRKELYILNQLVNDKEVDVQIVKGLVEND